MYSTKDYTTTTYEQNGREVQLYKLISTYYKVSVDPYPEYEES